MPSSRPFALGTEGEAAAARKFGLDPVPGTSGFYDLVHRSNGRKVQVKSASYERADGPGVFRVYREHLHDLRDALGSVVLVVVNRDNPSRKVLKVVKVSPEVVLDAGDRAGWRATGQADMRHVTEARIPWPELVALR